MNPYIGQEAQIYGIEEYQLCRGKGTGMRILHVRNGKGLEMDICPDRAGDITRLTFQGANMGYFSPTGYVAPSYYESTGSNFLKSFQAGFLTTCGLQSVGSPCVDGEEELPLHGSIGNTPAENYYYSCQEDMLIIHLFISDEMLFGRKLRMHRQIHVSLTKNEFEIHDTVENCGTKETPVEILYHMNMGYPLLDEDSIVGIASEKVIPRNEHAAETIDTCMKMEEPQANYEECCYYHECMKEGTAVVFQPKLNIGLNIEYNIEQLDCFTEWKMMGIRDYVLGLEPGNCYPDGRDVMRKQGTLKFLKAGETSHYDLKISLIQS